MKKLCLVAVVIGLAALVASLSVAGNKYRTSPYEPPESGEVAADESVRSMADCMEFSTNHKSRGHSGDKAEFKKQFGDPISESVSKITYNYDKYTKVVLNCSGKKCDCMCLSKY